MAWEVEDIRSQLRLEKETEMKAYREDFMNTIDKVSMVCLDAANRSIRAATKANEIANNTQELIDIHSTYPRLEGDNQNEKNR